MTELQPQIAKIQNKYPNANTNQAERARMSQEMSALYKKNGINPLSSLLIMVVQFPIFICVWGALTGSAWLSTGSFLNLNLSDSISSVLFNAANWGNGSAVTALILFILMGLAQVAAMLLPQWIQKRKQKNVAKLGKNPNANSQNRTMKIFTYVMMGMIIIMGFSLASAMGIYWFFGALFSIAQTLITQAIISKRKTK
jgi:YidC/Oxa1 family membrane protein insertase